ncbi:hypothetical protein HNQ50_003616 [Silvimonas terrae]|uniref:Uncharacterized protein n=1 Tax=Silvimonas terrae TaxID=300266 RepID=A0A840RKW8_9NEIS|nr:hypothetical protein [Silvimonas terrae]
MHGAAGIQTGGKAEYGVAEKRVAEGSGTAERIADTPGWRGNSLGSVHDVDSYLVVRAPHPIVK